MKGKTRPIRVEENLAQKLKEFVAKKGGSIKAALECGALWVMSDGAKEYLKKIKKQSNG